MFLNPNVFILIALIYWIWETSRSKLKKHSVTVRFIYSEKARKFWEIFTLLLAGTTYDKIKVKISQNCVAFSEHMNFTKNSSDLSLYEQIFLVISKFLQILGLQPQISKGFLDH